MFENCSWSRPWVARHPTRNEISSGFSPDDGDPQDRGNGLGSRGRLPDRTVKVSENSSANSLKKSGWKINMGRGKKLKEDLRKNEKQPH